jgi:hypothetical protein
VSAALNLARRPFRNERLPTIVLGLGCLVLAGVTVRHGFAAWNLMPGRGLSVEREAVSLEAEIASLRGEGDRLGEPSAAQAPVKEWAAVKDLVDRRAFSWTGLFADLEKALPPSVDDALALLAALQGHPHFRDALLVGYDPRDSEVAITCRVVYAPGRADPVAAVAARPAGAARPSGPEGAAP